MSTNYNLTHFEKHKESFNFAGKIKNVLMFLQILNYEQLKYNNLKKIFYVNLVLNVFIFLYILKLNFFIIPAL